MGRIKIDSNNEVLRKIIRRGSFTEQEFSRRLNLSKAIYVNKGRAASAKTDRGSSPFLSRENKPSTYDSTSIKIKKNARFFKVIVDAPSQPIAEYGNNGEGEYIEAKPGKYLALPVKPERLVKLKGASSRGGKSGGGKKARYGISGSKTGGPPVIIADGSSKFYRAGTRIALVKRVKTTRGHRLLLDSLKSAFSRR